MIGQLFELQNTGNEPWDAQIDIQSFPVKSASAAEGLDGPDVAGASVLEFRDELDRKFQPRSARKPDLMDPMQRHSAARVAEVRGASDSNPEAAQRAEEAKQRKIEANRKRRAAALQVGRPVAQQGTVPLHSRLAASGRFRVELCRIYAVLAARSKRAAVGVGVSHSLERPLVLLRGE